MQYAKEKFVLAMYGRQHLRKQVPDHPRRKILMKRKNFKAI